ncbi:progesterone-induced-blocking factor 1-like [Biomphalaria glabrata]|uniref:Progesterone-induced-blocking factor 1-like n=2 Tax=Biomphalaria glabrata TaxID=6526 RepID=A0A9W3B271_BIOGL|nr:progesterone-induced-blocking factor 1-like [Biomphalaria glabrata]XP_055893567.1 progesterone-induced-blocking factor 1-like [Biomphalaria glabrata]
MAGKDLSKTFEDIESEDLSLETSLPTDLTMSPDHSELIDVRNKKKHITKHLIERKQLLHDIQLLKIELSQKNLTLENMKVEHLQQIEELDEKLHDVTHQKQILQARLESELQIQSDEARKRQELIKRELDALRNQQQQLEKTNERLKEKAGDIRRTLKDLTLSEERYYHLRAQPEDELSLRDYVAIKFFETMRPLQTEVSQLRNQNNTVETEVASLAKEMLELQKHLEEERQVHGELRVKYHKIMTELAETTSKLKVDDYKVENYDKVKSERDGLEHDYMETSRQYIAMEAAFNTIQKERDELSRELSSSKQTIALLRQDKDYLTRQHSDINNKLAYSEEKLQQLNRQLEDAKLAREEMYEKYVSSRDQYKSEYENKLKEELEQIRVRTNTEIDRLRTSTREMYERENRNLREARDIALSERDRTIVAEREMASKYEHMLTEFRQLQATSESRLSEIQNELKIKMFEAERSQMIHGETVKNLGQAEMEIEKLQKKLEVLTKEYYTLQTSHEKKVVELEAMVSEKKAKLETYEKLEQDLDAVVMQAAEVEDEKEAEKVLFSYGYGANVASTTKRRMQQSVHLARRVLQLEKTNTGLRKELEEYKNKINSLVQQVETSNSLLDQTQQPYSYLIQSVKSRDEQINQLKATLQVMEKDLSKVEKEKQDLMRTHNQMSLDLERLLNQKEEMAVMKQVVLSLSERKFDLNKAKSRDFMEPSKSASTGHRFRNDFEIHDDLNVVKPGSLHLVKPKSSARPRPDRRTNSTKFSKVYGVAKS